MRTAAEAWGRRWPLPLGRATPVPERTVAHGDPGLARAIPPTGSRSGDPQAGREPGWVAGSGAASAYRFEDLRATSLEIGLGVWRSQIELPL